jgi:hypothetical protein
VHIVRSLCARGAVLLAALAAGCGDESAVDVTGAPPAAPQERVAPMPPAASSARGGPLAAQPAEPPASTGSALGVKLTGTVTGPSPGDGSAIFEREGRSLVRRVGQRIARARIEEIRPQEVVLDLEGSHIVLRVEDGTGGGSRDEPGIELALSGHTIPKPLGKGVTGRVRVEVDEALGLLRAMGQFSLGEGDSGMRIDQLKRGSPLGKLGLQPGDHILNVGGVPIHSAEEGLLLLAGTLYSEGGEIELTVLRSSGVEETIATERGALRSAAPSE